MDLAHSSTSTRDNCEQTTQNNTKHVNKIIKRARKKYLPNTKIPIKQLSNSTTQTSDIQNGGTSGSFNKKLLFSNRIFNDERIESLKQNIGKIKTQNNKILDSLKSVILIQEKITSQKHSDFSEYKFYSKLAIIFSEITNATIESNLIIKKIDNEFSFKHNLK